MVWNTHNDNDGVTAGRHNIWWEASTADDDDYVLTLLNISWAFAVRRCSLFSHLMLTICCRRVEGRCDWVGPDFPQLYGDISNIHKQQEAYGPNHLNCLIQERIPHSKLSVLSSETANSRMNWKYVITVSGLQCLQWGWTTTRHVQGKGTSKYV